jgi:sn-glycerol 3-phosphate transport system ATP-binding protein/multiple sugar transport system ATP-binding protein
MAGVSIRDVSKRYPGVDALAVDDLSMEIADGEFLVLLGPSGCGKTTTLRMVAGLEDITTGEIAIGERRVNELPPGERDIAFVFQFYALYPHLSVRDNITFPLRAQNVPRDEVERRLAEIARRLQIEHVLHKRPNRLPSGEQQRAALGRAIIRRPQVFLMDEPLTNLDAALRADMRVELKHLQGELGTTMIYVTHDQVEAMSMSHRIAVMNLGVLQQLAAPLDIYNHPQTLFVATFIGSPPMNIVDCVVADGGAVMAADDRSGDGFRLALGAAQAERLRRSGTARVAFGVRSENIALDDPESGEADLLGVVRVREPLGDETIYQVQVGETLLLARANPRTLFAEGARVGLHFDRDRLHLFDAATGKVI